MAIKDEVQGKNGYMKIVRDNYLGSTRQMANEAFHKYENETGIKLTKENILKNIDKTLQDLLIAETSIYNERSKHIIAEVMPYYYDNIFEQDDDNYPRTSESINQLQEIYKKCGNSSYTEQDFIHNIFEIISPIVDCISFSQKQSAKTRVGDSLQNHLEKILDVCEIPYETQKRKSTGGTIMDFIIPNVNQIDVMPEYTINIECQTTLKDRFRLTAGKSTHEHIKRYLATATGCNLITDKDSNDISIDKIKEIVIENNITLVVFENVKNKIKYMLESYKKQGKFSNVSLEDTNRLINGLNNKIITFEELIKKEIPNVLIYWN